MTLIRSSARVGPARTQRAALAVTALAFACGGRPPPPSCPPLSAAAESYCAAGADRRYDPDVVVELLDRPPGCWVVDRRCAVSVAALARVAADHPDCGSAAAEMACVILDGMCVVSQYEPRELGDSFPATLFDALEHCDCGTCACERERARCWSEAPSVGVSAR